MKTILIIILSFFVTLAHAKPPKQSRAERRAHKAPSKHNAANMKGTRVMLIVSFIVFCKLHSLHD